MPPKGKSELLGLKREAQITCELRGHSMGRWLNHENKMGAICQCLECDGYVQVLVKPMPNEIDIGGDMLALDCPIKY